MINKNKTFKKDKNRLINIILVILSTFLTLIVLETILNIIQKKNTPFITNLSSIELEKKNIKLHGFVDTLYYNRIASMPWHVPKSKWQWPGQKNHRVEFFIKGKWNNYGCNDIYFDSKKASELFIGDSFVESLQVPLEDTFYSLYRKGSRNEHEIYSCGYSGWSPKHIYENLSGINKKNLSLGSLNIKHVHLFTYLGNDLTDTYQKKIFKNQSNCSLIYKFYTFELINNFIRRYITNDLSRCIEPIMFAYDVQNKHHKLAVYEYNKYLIKLKKFLKLKKIGLTVYIIPPLAFYKHKKFNFSRYSFFRSNSYLNYINGLDYNSFKNNLYTQGKKNLFKVIDLSQVLNEDDYYTSDGHFNKKGHNKIAIYLEFLKNKDN